MTDPTAIGEELLAHHALWAADEIERLTKRGDILNAELSGFMKAATKREAAQSAEIERLTAVAVAAKALVGSITVGAYGEMVPEPKVTALESALAAAGYDMTDEEFEERVAVETGAPPR